MSKDDNNRIENTTEDVRTPEGALKMLIELQVNRGTAIESQERRGQKQLTQSAVLPVEGTNTDEQRAQWAAIGVALGGVVPNDDIFRYAALPPGWAKVATEHSMWSEIRDDQGRVRAMIFYKAAFYDRSAHVSLRSRFRVDYREIDKSFPYGESPVVGVVLDAGTEIWVSEAIPGERACAENAWGGAHRKACDMADKWLIARGLDRYQDPTAYWDLDLPATE